jgi:hypothetical protein
VLVVFPLVEAGSAAPIAIGAGIAAIGLLALSLATGVTPPLLLAVLLILGDFGAALVLGDADRRMAPVAAGGLYLVVELAMRSLEIRGRLPGWRSFTVRDAVAVGAVTVAVVAMAWAAAAVGTGEALPGGIFTQAVAVAAVAAVIGIVWVLVDRE